MFLLSLKVRSVPCVEYGTVAALVVTVLPPWAVAVLADESVDAPTKVKAFIASVCKNEDEKFLVFIPAAGDVDVTITVVIPCASFVTPT